MLSTMQDGPLLISGILRHGQAVYGDSEVLTVGPTGDRVGTFAWNDQEHLEAYLAVPSMGAVLHTLNIRLFPEQLAYVVNHGEDKVVIVDASVAPLLAKVRDQCPTVEHVVVVGEGDTDGLGPTIAYEEFIGAEEPGYQWPDVDERSAAAMCYTSGTTGNPKGVVYSHRSTWLHSFSGMSANALGATEHDRVLVIVPMFHANAWGMPYTAFMAGTDLILPERFLQAEPLARMFAELRPTLSLGVPTIWNDLLRYSQTHDVAMESLRMITAGGSAVPRTLMEAYRDRFDVAMIQGWGMTETSPVCAMAFPPKGVGPDHEMDWRARTGRVLAGVQIRVVADDGTILPADGHSVGEFEASGPWVTGSYYGDPTPDRFHDGWLRTGDVGWMDDRGFMQISDRTKDVIKSGGEWISSVELENEVMAHPAVFEAAVIGVPDPKWDERPLVVVVTGPNEARPEPEVLVEFLSGRVARWWLPERWAFVDELPKTSVGKFDKKALRIQVADGTIEILEVVPSRTGD
jgi:fatty-acyl-CoA synthase